MIISTLGMKIQGGGGGMNNEITLISNPTFLSDWDFFRGRSPI